MAKLTQQYVFDRIGQWQLNFLTISNSLYQFGTATRELPAWHGTYISIFLGQNGYYLNQYNQVVVHYPSISIPKKPGTYREQIMGSLLFYGKDTRTPEQVRADEVAIKTYRTKQLGIVKQLRSELVGILPTLPFYLPIQQKMISDLDNIITKLEKVL